MTLGGIQPKLPDVGPPNKSIDVGLKSDDIGFATNHSV